MAITPETMRRNLDNSTNPGISPNDNRISTAGYRYDLAIDFKEAESNPCSRVKKFKLDNGR